MLPLFLFASPLTSFHQATYQRAGARRNDGHSAPTNDLAMGRRLAGPRRRQRRIRHLDRDPCSTPGWTDNNHPTLTTRHRSWLTRFQTTFDHLGRTTATRRPSKCSFKRRLNWTLSFPRIPPLLLSSSLHCIFGMFSVSLLLLSRSFWFWNFHAEVCTSRMYMYHCI